MVFNKTFVLFCAVISHACMCAVEKAEAAAESGSVQL